jgi:hypothetical protein
MRSNYLISFREAACPEEDYLCLVVFSSDTVSFLRPFALREAKTLRPFAEAILSRKPCLFFLFLREGWYVRFILLIRLAQKI